MALVLDAYSTVVVLAAIDASVHVKELIWDPTAIDSVAEAETAFQAWYTDYQAVGAGVLKSYYHKENYLNDAFALPTSQDAEPGEHAIITTNINGNAAKTAIINLPFPISTAGTVFVSASGPNRNVVNSSSTALASYLDNFEPGGAQISDGEYSAGNVVRGRRAR